ncbi:glycosyltransferase family 1 protein [Fusobacterium sp.]|uniref:glycosyltransferase family 1 protein n=1 Tax=Fusobacterium sp. TaxID=68766 RepID=UPI001DF2A6E4|nr:glycosyltransferase family 1 protein [Fusobacterium sp.]MBS5789926.1 glycosyltransferase family 1 protein [Fusobacterium sp.]
MIRVLQVVNNMHRAGLETMLMNYYRNIDRTKIQFDFLTHRPEKGDYDDEIISMGGKVYYAPRLYPQNYLQYFKWMKKFFNEHPEYKIVHSHIDTMSAFPLLAAKLNNIPIRIAHSHTSKLDRDLKFPIKYLAKLIVPYVANHYFSCGEVAGKFLYGNKKFEIIRNAIDVENYKFNNKVREKKRKELNLNNEFVIGHVGRYCYIKNQSFIIDIFNEILKERSNSKLLLIGSGPDEELLRQKVNKLNLNNNVIFLINRSDVDELYQVMDAFVMPSLFEGVPLVAVEAQANGLKCFLSDKISEEVFLTKNIEKISLDQKDEEWKEKILNSEYERQEEIPEELFQKGYDIKRAMQELIKKYIEYTK